MLIQAAGTSGSGKSHLFRALIKWARENGGVDEQEAGYTLITGKGKSKAFSYVLGKYDVPTGGCDTIHDVSEIYDTIRNQATKNDNVLFEGLFVMNMTRGPQLAEEFGRDFVVLQLTTPLATCLESINQRRAERGEGALESTRNTEDNYRRARNYCSTMRDAGAKIIKVDRSEALEVTLKLMRAL